MIDAYDRLMAQLHTRSVAGAALAPEEQAQLQAWYVAQDGIEATHLRIPGIAPLDLGVLQAAADAAMQRLEEAIQDVQRLAQQNAALRHQITVLEQRLADQVVRAA